MANSVHHKLYFIAIYSATSISDSLSKLCRYVLVLIVRPLDFGYLVVEAGIHCNDLWKKCIGIQLMKRTCIRSSQFPFKQATCSCSVEKCGILCALTSLYRRQKYERSPFSRWTYIRMGWVFGILDAKSVPKSIPPRDRYQVGPFFSFLSFFLYVLTSMEGSVPMCCAIQFMTPTCFQQQLKLTPMAECQRYWFTRTF